MARRFRRRGRHDLRQLDQERGDGAAMFGHHDRMGLNDDAPSKSWNSSHASRGALQPDRTEGHRRRRPVLLLRGELGAWASIPAS